MNERVTGGQYRAGNNKMQKGIPEEFHTLHAKCIFGDGRDFYHHQNGVSNRAGGDRLWASILIGSLIEQLLSANCQSATDSVTLAGFGGPAKRNDRSWPVAAV